jgi:hypothetical protein
MNRQDASPGTFMERPRKSLVMKVVFRSVNSNYPTTLPTADLYTAWIQVLK